MAKRGSRDKVILLTLIDLLLQLLFLFLFAVLVISQTSLSEKDWKDWIEISKVIKEGNINVPSFGPTWQMGQDCIFQKKDWKSPEQCRPIGFKPNDLDKLPELRLCLNTSDDKKATTPSTHWSINNPEEIQFDGFTDSYIEYLNAKQDKEKLAHVARLAGYRGRKFSPEEILNTFAFIREVNCYHERRIRRPGQFSDSQLNTAFSALNKLKLLAPN